MSDKELIGLVLAGGQSLRMGSDKAFLFYHQAPQYIHVASQLKTLCGEVYISRKKDLPNSAIFKSKDANESETFPIVSDDPEFGEIGPMSAWLSYFKRMSQPVFIVGVDYPLLILEDMEYLLRHRNSSKHATVYFNPDSGFFEPMIGIYESSFKDLLLSSFEHGVISIQRILKDIDVEKVVPLDKERIRSFDHKEDYESFRNTHDTF